MEGGFVIGTQGGTGGGIPDAPSDGFQYARKNGIWDVVVGGGAAVASVNGRSGIVTLTKSDVGLSLVDNTSDASKPISTATQTALNLKANSSSLATVATSGLYSDLTGKPTIPVTLADLTSDTTHRIVTDSQISTWNAKQDALVSGTSIKTINSTSLLGSGDISISYTLPVASTTVLGGVKQGTNTSIDGTGVISVSFSGLQTTLVSGTSIKTINGTSLLGSGDISISGGGGEPPLGNPSVDGYVLSSTAAGVRSWVAQSSSYTLPTASTTVLGGVKVDGTTITISGGVISSSPSYTLPIATTTVLGGVKQGANTSIDGTGVISVSFSSLQPLLSGTGFVKASGTTISYDNTSYQAALVSGTNIKTVNGNSLLGSGDITINSGTWGFINGTLSSQTDLVSALSAKQDTLVSGTNIKTINGSTLLGSGNITITGGGGAANGYFPSGW